MLDDHTVVEVLPKDHFVGRLGTKGIDEKFLILRAGHSIEEATQEHDSRLRREIPH